MPQNEELAGLTFAGPATWLETRFHDLLVKAGLVGPDELMTPEVVDAACSKILNPPQEKKYYFANIIAAEAGRQVMLTVYCEEHPLTWCRRKMEEIKIQTAGTSQGKFTIAFMGEISKEIYDAEIAANSPIIQSSGGKLPPPLRK